MNFISNTIFNYCVKFYLGLSSIIFAPLFLGLFGTELYGFIAVSLVLQSWVQLLDVGMSNSLSRVSTEYKEGKYKLRSYVCTLAYFFGFSLALFFILNSLATYFSEYILVEVFNIPSQHALPYQEYLFITILSITTALISMPIRSILVGFSCHKHLAILDFISITIRNPICYLTVYIYGGGLEIYLYYWLFANCLVFFGTLTLSIVKIVKIGNSTKPNSSSHLYFFDVVRFAGFIALSSFCWMSISQLDKLILALSISSSEFSIFSLVAQASSVIMIVTSPFSIALLPKLVEYKSNEKMEDFSKLLNVSFIVIVGLVYSVSINVSFYSYELLLLWSNNTEVAQLGNILLPLYLFGNLFLVIGAFAYYIQFGYGNLRLHTIMSITSIFLISPAYVFMIGELKELGAALTWLFYNIIVGVFWLPFVVRKFDNMISNIYKNLFIMTISLILITSVFKLISMRFEELWFLIFLISSIISVLSLTLVLKPIRVMLFERCGIEY